MQPKMQRLILVFSVFAPEKQKRKVRFFFSKVAKNNLT